MKIAYYLIASVFILITLSLSIFIALQFVYSDKEKPVLQSITVLFRNGDRMPHTDAGESYKNNPNVENDYFPFGQSGLTNEGKLKEYKLGQFLREKYNEFLDSTYQAKVLEARSTNYDRTKVSLELVLAGLYPPNNAQMWNSSLNWQPIPFLSEPETNDVLLTSILCPRYLQERKKIAEITEVKRKLKTFENLLQNLTIFTGKDVKHLSDIYKIYFTLKMEQKMNLTVPNWAHDYLNNPQVMEAIMFDYELMVYNDLMRKLTAGPMIRKITENMINLQKRDLRDNKNIKNARKMYLYSGHHYNLLALFSALGFNNFNIPDFSSAIIIEFYKSNEDYHVKILHYLGNSPAIEILEIPGCLKLCPLNKFLELMKPVTPTENEDICA